MTAGCGDPSSSRLAVGAKAFTVDHDPWNGTKDDKIPIFGLDPRGDAYAFMSEELVQVAQVSVVSDVEESGGDSATRKVRVHVEDGAFAGQTGYVRRQDLRPE